MKHIAKHITSFIRWGIAGLSLLMALIALLAGEFVSGSFLIVFGLLVTPLSNKYLFDRVKWQVPSWVKVVLGFVLLIGFALTTSSKPSIAVKSPTNESPAAIEVVYVAGKTVKLYHNDVDLGEKQTDKNRKAVFENVELVEGDNNFRVEVVGENNSVSRVIVYDTTPPDKPVVNLAGEVRNKNLQVQGTSEPNATIKILFNGSAERIVKTNSKGEFSTKYVLGNPENSFEFEAIDSAGNSSGLTDKTFVTYIDTKKLADEEKKAQQQEDLTNLFDNAENLYNLSNSANELVAASLIEYSSLKSSRSTLYNRIKDAEAAQDKIWGGLVDLGNNTPDSLKDFKDEITGFDGGIVYLQVAVKLRKEAINELAKYVDSGSLQNMRNYETKLGESTSYAAGGFSKLQSVGDKLGIELVE